jgi:hypothetical protein
MAHHVMVVINLMRFFVDPHTATHCCESRFKGHRSSVALYTDLGRRAALTSVLSGAYAHSIHVDCQLRWYLQEIDEYPDVAKWLRRVRP